MSTILVTGGAGMIGSNLVKSLVKYGHTVKVVDNLWRGRLANLVDESGKEIINLSEEFYTADLTIPGACKDILPEIDYIIHLADTVAGINYVFANQGEIFRQNMLINSNIIDAARQSRIKGFIYVGTACSFPASMQNRMDFSLLAEDDLYPAEPESAYGWSKLMGQYETELMEKETGIPTTTLILHNVYGAPTDFSPERSQVIPALIRRTIMNDNHKLLVWGSGEQGRAFVHVDDIVNALTLALEKGLGHGAIQIGPEICTSIKELAETIITLSGKDIEIIYDHSKPEGDKARAANFSKAKEILGWYPQVPLKDGITRLYHWMEEQISHAGYDPPLIQPKQFNPYRQQ